MMSYDVEDIISIVQGALLGKACWYVSSGQIDETFQLAFGDKVPRKHPLRNQQHPLEYRNYEGEANLLVWCSWRLDSTKEAITSSDDVCESVVAGLNQIIGSLCTKVTIDRPCWDAHLIFSNGLTLHVFADHVSDSASFDGNWEIALRDKAMYFGPGAAYVIEPRDGVIGQTSV